MPLDQFRLHTGACKGKYKRSDRSKKDCECVIHVEGKVGDRFIRESTHCRTWSRVKKKVDKANRDGVWDNTIEPDRESIVTGTTTVENACDTYIAGLSSKSVKNLLSASASKHKTVIKRMGAYATRLELTHISQLDATVLLGFQETWWPEYKIGSESTKGYIVKLRKFGKYAVKKGWWPRNYALDLEYPEEDYSNEADPTTTKRKALEDFEMNDLLESARSIELDVQQAVTNWEIETFILVMRWAGLALIDASLLQAHEVVGDQIIYYRKKLKRSKNKIRVEVPIPKFLQDRLAAIRRNGLHQGKYYFCRGSVNNPTDVWNKRLRRIFDLAGIKYEDAQPSKGDSLSHRFRHTFAAYLLNTEMDLGNGTRGYIDLADVAKMLGHANERTTLKYYRHIMKPRNDRRTSVMRNHLASLDAA